MSCTHLDLMLQKHLLVNILQFSDDIGQCARSVTTQLREIVGSRIVALFERSPQNVFRLAGICPERRKDFFSDETARRLIDEAAKLNEPELFKPGHGTIGMLLAEMQMQTSFVIPLRSNEETHGFLLLLDILDLHNTDEILEAFKSMASLLSLVMRNSFLYRNLEELVKQRTTELHEAGQLNQQILNSIHEGIVVYDKDMRIKAWNPFMENLSGKSANEISGRLPEEAFPFLGKTGIRSRLSEVLAGRIPPQMEFEYEINGIQGWAIESQVPLRNENNEVAGNGVFLVMDDEEVVRETLGCMLESFGYTPVLKNNGQEAIDFFVAEHEAGRRIAGMLFDLTIAGGMGGKEAIEEIRKLCQQTPAFVTSGYANDPVMADPKKFGFTACICKPFQLADLANILNQFVKQS